MKSEPKEGSICWFHRKYACGDNCDHRIHDRWGDYTHIYCPTCKSVCLKLQFVGPCELAPIDPDRTFFHRSENER